MRKQLIALSTGCAIALAGLSTPAAANEDDIGALVFGALALFVLGEIIEDELDDRPSNPPLRPNIQPAPNNILPASCIRVHNTDHGRVRLLGQRCLNRTAPQKAALPQNCHRRVVTHNGVRRGYKPRCLRRHGYQIR